MTVKSIIDVQVNDAEFKNFSALFEKYKAALGEMPGAWKTVGDEIGKTGSTFETIVSAMVAQQIISKQIADAEKERDEEATRRRKAEEAAARAGAFHWKDMARTTKDVAGNVIRATESLLKWTGLTAAFTGLLGAGGLFGIDRMAAGVASGSRSSRGLGLTYGEQKAFGINFGQVVDPDSYLGAVNQQLHSTNKAALFGAGLTASEMKGDTAEVGANLLDHLKKIADSTDPSMLANVMQARGLDQVTSLEDMMRLRAMSPDEFAKRRAQYGADAKALGVNNQTQDLWSSFTRQMSRAGTEIENVFVRGLVRIEPQLEKLSGSFVKMIDSLSQSPVVRKWMDDVADGLTKFAETVDSPKFIAGVVKFGEDVVEIAEFTGKLVHGIAWMAKGIEDVIESVPWLAKKLGVAVGEKNGGFAVPARHGIPLSLPEATTREKALTLGHAVVKNAEDRQRYGGAWLEGQFDAATQRHNLPPGLLASLAKAESGFNPNAVSAKGAEGLFQFMPATAKAYGVQNSFDPAQATEGAGRYLEKLLKEFKGDVAKAIAAYNWGEGNVEKATAKYGDQWQSHIPRETANEIAKVLGKDRGGSRTTVTVNNNTGGSAVVSTAQVAG